MLFAMGQRFYRRLPGQCWQRLLARPTLASAPFTHHRTMQRLKGPARLPAGTSRVWLPSQAPAPKLRHQPLHHTASRRTPFRLRNPEQHRGRRRAASWLRVAEVRGFGALEDLRTPAPRPWSGRPALRAAAGAPPPDGSRRFVIAPPEGAHGGAGAQAWGAHPQRDPGAGPPPLAARRVSAVRGGHSGGRGIGPESPAQSSDRPLGRLFQALALPGAGVLLRLEDAREAGQRQQSSLEGRAAPGLREESPTAGQPAHKLAAPSSPEVGGGCHLSKPRGN